ncbi:DnaA regulatory inactivator Hda [Gynuella sunshinyii]|uniref:ATPase involved in DNA replication initiation n=1 Tax=Gynuella sunshinyii YC6258 TaxID=1445510 RepID=A0A0C5VR60_9GAMM|nr:DnaA regulatory inactivator Hda [Gynuella sunshinyii]AJQ95893.1 ATPase involved in DNA replication initiation [Gynuella sunshinyii YC6258]
MKPVQLPLAVKLPEPLALEHFYAEGNEELLNSLSGFVGNEEHLLFIWGESGAGRSYLLQAMCREHNAFYFSFRDTVNCDPSLMDGLEQYSLVCIDDVHLLSGKSRWQEAMFSLFNRTRQLKRQLLLAADVSPGELSLEMSDLVSRFSWGLIFRLHALNDSQKVRALIARSERKGLNLTPEVARYIVTHFPRDVGSLFQMLDTLDLASLTQQRRITIPLIKEVIG